MRLGRVSIDKFDVSKVKQSERDVCDPNVIMRRYMRTHDSALLNQRTNVNWGLDLTTIPDYQSALNTVVKAQNAFNSLPALVRARFSGDPLNLIDFLSDEKNRDEAVKLGLIDVKPVLPPDGGKVPEEGST